MRWFVCFLAVVFLGGCAREPQGVFFGGKIINPTNPALYLYYNETFVDSIQVDRGGFFSQHFDSLQNGLYRIVHPPEFQYVMIEQGDSLMLRLNTIDFDESLVFGGIGAEKNNYLMDVFLQNENENNQINSYFSQEPEEFLSSIEELRAQKLEKLDLFVKKHKLSKLSNNILKASIELPYYYKAELYPQFHPFNDQCRHSLSLDPSFYEFRSTIDLNDANLSGLNVFLNYALVRLQNESSTEKYNQNTLQFNMRRLEALEKLINNNDVRLRIARYLAYDYMLQEVKFEKIEKYVEKIKSVIPNGPLMSELLDLEINIANLQVGKPCPDIGVYDENQLVKSLPKTIKNPTVIFFWSYEQLDHKEMIFGKMLQFSKEFQNIQFVSINLNNDIERWQSSIKALQKSHKSFLHYQSVSFDNISRKMIISNLNKVMVLDKDGHILNGFLNIQQLHEFLKKS